MKKYILIIILTISIVLGISLSVNKIIILQASGTVYPPDYISVRVRDSALDVRWRHNPDNLSVDNYKVYYNTVSGDRTDSILFDSSYYSTGLTGLSNSVPYYIVVSAIAGGTESDTGVSNEWEGTPAPANTTVTRFIPGGTTVSAYTMISTPVEPQNTKISTVLGDNLGPYDNTQWRCFHWDQQNGGYEEGSSSNNDFGPGPEEPLVGAGGWLISRNDVTIDMTGCKYDHYYPAGSDQYHIYLEPGWNQIGCPYNVRVPLSDIYVEDPASPDNWYGITDSGNIWTDHEVWGWYDGAYKSMINLVPIYGFFLRNKTADTVKIKIYRPAVPPPGGPDYSAPAPGEDYDSASYAPAYTGGSDGGPPPPPGGLVSADLSSAGGGGCFIATAAFGTPMAKEVVILKEFRDEYMLPNRLGKTLVKAYYKTSPPLAEFIRNKPGLRAMVRVSLKPIISFSRWLVTSKSF